MPLVQCDNCEEYGCPDCNEEWVVTSDESVLCPECSADIRAEYNKATENGTKVCGSCACFKNEDANGVGECEYPEDHKNRTNLSLIQISLLAESTVPDPASDRDGRQPPAPSTV